MGCTGSNRYGRLFRNTRIKIMLAHALPALRRHAQRKRNGRCNNQEILVRLSALKQILTGKIGV